MPLNLLTLPATEAERIAYSEGFTMAAELFARIVELEAERDAIEEELEDLKDKAAEDSLTQWENQNGNPDQYKGFFFECFARLAGEYPAPSVTSDCDKNVVFSAIEKGESCEQ